MHIGAKWAQNHSAKCRGRTFTCYHLPEEGGSDFSIWQQPRRRPVAELRLVLRRHIKKRIELMVFRLGFILEPRQIVSYYNF